MEVDGKRDWRHYCTQESVFETQTNLEKERQTGKEKQKDKKGETAKQDWGRGTEKKR